LDFFSLDASPEISFFFESFFFGEDSAFGSFFPVIVISPSPLHFSTLRYFRGACLLFLKRMDFHNFSDFFFVT